jgi:hypothetical protein
VENILSIGFLCENRIFQFSNPEGPIFTENSYIHLCDLILLNNLSYLVSLYPKPSFHSILLGAPCQTMRMKGGLRQGTMSLSITKGDRSKEPRVNKICLEVTWKSAVNQALTTPIAAQRMILRMTPTFPHLGLVLMDKGWQVLVAAGQQGKK